MSRTRAALSGLAAGYFTKALSVALAFIVTPIVLSYLGDESYGIWVIVGSLLGYVGILDLGLSGSSSILISRVTREESVSRISALATNSVLIHTLAGALVIIAGLAGHEYFSSFFRLEPAIRAEANLAFLLALIALGLGFPAKTLKAVLRGTQNIAILKLIEFASLLLRTAVLLGLLALGLGLVALPIAVLVANTAGLPILILAVRKKVPGLRPSVGMLQVQTMREVLGAGGWWFLGGLGALFIYQVDNIILGRYLGPGIVTMYALTYRIPDLARQQIYEVNRVLTPGLGELAGQGDLVRMGRVYLLALRTTMVAAVTAFAFLLLFNEAIISLWVGAGRFGGQGLTLLFACTLVYLVLFHTSAQVLAGLLRLKQLGLIRCVEGLLNLVLSLLLVRRLGYLGVALATLIAGLITSAWYVPWQTFRKLHLSISNLRQSVLVPLAKFSLGLLVFAFFLSRMSARGVWPSSATFLLFIGGTSALAVTLAFTRDETLDLLNKLRSVR